MVRLSEALKGGLGLGCVSQLQILPGGWELWIRLVKEQEVHSPEKDGNSDSTAERL
jgi:hypothetical protein